MAFLLATLASVIGGIFVERHLPKTSKEAIPVRLRRDDNSAYRHIENNRR